NVAHRYSSPLACAFWQVRESEHEIRQQRSESDSPHCRRVALLIQTTLGHDFSLLQAPHQASKDVSGDRAILQQRKDAPRIDSGKRSIDVPSNLFDRTEPGI